MGLKLKDILTENSEFSLINEAGLSRLFSGVYGGNLKQDFCVMSGFRKNYTLKQNRSRNKQIYSELSKYKMGGYPLIGHWKEAPDDMDWETTPEEMKVPVTEESVWFYRPSYVSINDFQEVCTKLCRMFNQDSVIFGIASDTSKEGIYYLKKDGSMSLAYSTVRIRPEELGDAYSVMRGNPTNPFVFEGTAQPANIISNMMFKHENMRWFSK
jgi:hypothetical protein